MTEMNEIGAIIIAIVIIVCLFLWENKRDDECRSKGGVPIHGYYSFACLKGEEIK